MTLNSNLNENKTFVSGSSRNLTPGDEVVASQLNDNRAGYSLDSFTADLCPVASTDYVGLDKIDPRLADRAWRLENLYWVINEKGELVRFKLRDAQRWLLSNMHWKNILLKARQLGFTTFICIFLLDYALFNKNKQIGIIAHTQTDATTIFRKVKVAWDYFPTVVKDYIKLETTGDSKVEYEFTNGSVMRISTSLRSGTYQAVLITEFGKICARFPDKAEEIITGTLPAANKGLVFIESTAEGEEGPYYDMVMEAMEAKRLRKPLSIKEYKFFFFPWYQNPENAIPLPPQTNLAPIDENTRNYLQHVIDNQKIQLTEEQCYWYFLEQKTQKAKMKQEHPSSPEEAFLVSGNKLFDPKRLDAMLKAKKEPLEVNGDYSIYEHYKHGHVYGLGADVSQGVSRDSSTMVVIDFTTSEVVLTYKSSTIDPVTFAHEVKKTALAYGACIAAPEANNVGLTTCITLNQIYPNVYTQVREGLLEDHPTAKLGWLSTSASKPKMMYELSEAFDEATLKCFDEGIILEAKKFNKEDSLSVTVGPTTTRHFDLLSACAIAWQMRIHASKGVDPEREAQAAYTRERNTNSKINKFR